MVPTGQARSQAPAPSAGELSVNGVVIDAAAIERETAEQAQSADPVHAARRALVVRELLRQRASALGLLAAGAALDDATVDRLLAAECAMPTPTEEECRRYYLANAQALCTPEIVMARHILFALTDATSMSLLREQAEQTLQALTEHPERFDSLARRLSNCPSGQLGGNLGQLTRGESVPEFEAAVFGNGQTGLLPGLVRTRYGFHIVLVERRIPGRALDFETVRETIARYLTDRVRHKAIQQYVARLAAGATLHGIELDIRAGPLMQ